MQFGILRDKSDKYGCAWINHPSVNQIVKDAKKKYDYVIIIAHAGLEGVDYPLPECVIDIMNCLAWDVML